MTLGELIERLSREDGSVVVENGFRYPHSYRGYYERLAFEPAKNVTVASMLEAARSADGATYSGWKGGEFTMQKWTECHLAEEGRCGDALTGATIDLMLMPNWKTRAQAAEAKVAALEARLAEVQTDRDDWRRASNTTQDSLNEERARLANVVFGIDQCVELCGCEPGTFCESFGCGTLRKIREAALPRREP